MKLGQVVACTTLVMALSAMQADGQQRRTGRAEAAEVVARAGDWTLRRYRDSFTDRTTCSVVHRNNPYVAFDDEGLMLIYRGRGGVQGVEYRIDDHPPSGMRLPTRIQQEAGFVRVPVPETSRILQGRRLRAQALTVLQGLARDDVNLVGASGLVARIAECQRGGTPSAAPGPVRPGQAQRQPTPLRP